MSRCLTTLAAVLLCAASGCNQFPLFSGSPRGEWTIARNPRGAAQAAQPFLIVPSADNPAEEGVFAEIDRLRDSNEELQQSVAQAVADNERTQAALNARGAELNAARTELTTLQQQVDRLTSDVQDWREEVAVMHNSLYERQRDELSTLDGLIVTVEGIVEEMQTPAPPALPVSNSDGPASQTAPAGTN